jgi:PAS domain-containing protein
MALVPSNLELFRLGAGFALEFGNGMKGELLSTGFSVRISFRAVLPASENLLLCMEEGSLLQRAEGKWRQLEAELTTTVDAVQVGAILLGPAGRIRFVDVQFSQYFGMDHRQIQSVDAVENPQAMISPRFGAPET